MGLLAREPQRLQAACDEISRYGGKVVGEQTDVAHAEQVERGVIRVARELATIDSWVNNAMVTVFAPFGEVSARSMIA